MKRRSFIAAAVAACLPAKPLPVAAKPAFALGGPVAVGTSYLIGERGCLAFAGVSAASWGWLHDGGNAYGSLRNGVYHPPREIRQAQGIQTTTPCKLLPEFWKKGTA